MKGRLSSQRKFRKARNSWKSLVRKLRRPILLVGALMLTGTAVAVLLNPESSTQPLSPLPLPVPDPKPELGGKSSLSPEILLPSGIPPQGAEPIQRPKRPTEQKVVPPPETPRPVAQAPKEDRPWTEHIVQRGDSLSAIFKRLGIPQRDLYEALHVSSDATRLENIRPNEVLRFQLTENNRLYALRYPLSPLRELKIWRVEEGFACQISEREVEHQMNHASATIHSSLFLAGQRAGLSDRMIMELAEIFAWDIDFAMDIRQGDRFTVVYEEYYQGGELLDEGPILGVEFVNQGHTFRAVRFVDSQGKVSYFTPDGQSLRKAFLRTPVKFSRISSHFDLNRRHPILNRIRAHKGVDYAAPSGTPIRATGDGKITFKGRKGGYGRTVIVQHGNRYSTLYAHMSGYARGISENTHVRQGQVIGYVGKSGLATGPHLHYEFRVDGLHRNPLTVRLPKAKPIPERYKNRFREQTAPLLAQLDQAAQLLVAARE